MTLPSRYSVAAILSAAVLALAVDAHAAGFVSAFRSSKGAFFLTAQGDVYRLNGPALLGKALSFSEKGRPYRWEKKPTAFVQWNGNWFVSDSTQRIARFDGQGVLQGHIDGPARASVLGVAGDSLWFVNPLATSRKDQLWQSADGRTFKPFDTGDGTLEMFASPARNLLILSGSGSGALYMTSIIGGPTVERVFPRARRLNFPVAYSRSKGRDGLVEVTGPVADMTGFSAPIRDLFALEDSGLIVLRNREDVPGASGQLELMLGRRADHYDAGGRHLATATFTDSVHWIAAVTPAAVVGVSRDGRVISAPWGKPVAGRILAR